MHFSQGSSRCPTTNVWPHPGVSFGRTPSFAAGQDPLTTRGSLRAAWWELPLAIFNTKDFLDFAEYDGLVLMS